MPELTDFDTISLTWAAPAFDGGSPIINYKLWFDNASGSTFQVLADGLTTTSFTAEALTQGATYQFKV